MNITQVSHSNRRDIRDFINLPFTIYHDTPQWVPPLMPGERARFKPDYNFYQHSDAAFFLARNDEGKPVGRIAVLEHRPHNEYRGSKDALLYLYEAFDDDAIPKALFAAAEDWARKRELNKLVGPKGFMTGDGHGLLIEGFEYRPALGVPYNPPYYVRHWEEVIGMTKVLDYYSALINRDEFTYPERVRRIARKIRERRNYHVPKFTSKKALLGHAQKLKEAYNNAFAPLWAYTPIPPVELDAIIEKLMFIARPHLMKLIFKDDEVIGFAFTYPDITAALQRQKGRIWPFGWIDILIEKQRTQWLTLNGAAILPQYQGLGANAVLYDELMGTLLDETFSKADFVQTQENNVRMLSDLAELVPVNIHKKHRVYDKAIS